MYIGGVGGKIVLILRTLVYRRALVPGGKLSLRLTVSEISVQIVVELANAVGISPCVF